MKFISDFRQDVADKGNIEAEEVVYAYLVNRFDLVVDKRGYNTAWDFEFQKLDDERRWTIDVKRDKNVDTSGRLPFEICDLRTGGILRPTWGVNPDLDFLAVVNGGLDTAYIANMRQVRNVITAVYQRGHPVWAVPNRGGYITIGIAVPIEKLKTEGATIKRVDLSRFREAA